MGGKLAVKSEVQKGTVFTLDIRLMKHPGPLPHLYALSFSVRRSNSYYKFRTRTIDIELPPLIAAMAAYHRFGKKKQKIYRLPSFSRGRNTDLLHKSGSDKLSRKTPPFIDKHQATNKNGDDKRAEEKDDQSTASSSEASPRCADEVPENTLSVLLVEDNLVNQKVWL